MDVSDEAMQHVFGTLRPVCVGLTQQPSRDKVQALHSMIRDVTDGQLALLQDYVLFPLRLILKQSRDRELITDALMCLKQVLSRSCITRTETFHDLFNSLGLLISNPEAYVSDVSEELKLAAVECLEALFSQLPPAVRRSIYHPSFLPSLGHAVSLLLGLITQETYRRLRIVAARCLMQLLWCNAEEADLQKVGDTFSSFLPGIALATTGVATGDVKQGHLVIKAAIEVWTETVVKVMGDRSHGQTKDGSKCSAGIEDKFEQLRVTRSEDWVKATAEKLQILVNKLSGLVMHPSCQVRLAVVKWAKALLTQCYRSMPAATPNALDALVQLSADEYSEVSKSSEEALSIFQAQMDEAGNEQLLALLEDNLHDLAIRLPRLMRTADDEKKLSNLVLFSGYLRLLGPRVKNLLRSSSHLQRVSTALLQVLEFDTSHVELVQEAHTGFQLAIGSSHWRGTTPRFYFKHFRDDKIHQQIITVCHILGAQGDLNLLIDYFLETSHQGPTYRKQAFLVINEIILASKESAREERFRIVESLIEEYLSPENWNLATAFPVSDQISHQKISMDMRIVPVNHQQGTLMTRTSNILQICILLQGISHFAQVSGVEFRKHLISVIYPLMERLGDQMAAIHSTAQAVSHNVATACKYRDVHEMVCDNSDYLVNAISLRLRHIECYPDSPCVLQAVLKHSTSTVLPLFEDILLEVLQVLDDHYDERAAVFLRVLYTLTAAIVMWYPQSNKQEDAANDDSPPPAKVAKRSSNAKIFLKDQTAKSSEPKELPCLAEFLLDYEKLKTVAGGGDMGDESKMKCKDGEFDESGDYSGMEAEEEEKVVPQHIQVVKQILERCCHFLSSPDPRLRLLVLRIMAEGCVVMQIEQDEMLPMAHKLWAPFVQRFRDDEPMVVLQAILTLETLGEVTGDFLRRRVVEEVLPPMADFLTKQAKVSVRAGSQYRYTVLSKLQVAVMKTMSGIARQVRLKGCLLYRVARSCLPYLSVRQPSHLQQAAVLAFEQYILADIDSAWLLLIEQYSPVQPKPPDKRFANHKMGTSKRTEFTENIEKLLTQINSEDRYQ